MELHLGTKCRRPGMVTRLCSSLRAFPLMKRQRRNFLEIRGFHGIDDLCATGAFFPGLTICVILLNIESVIPPTCNRCHSCSKQIDAEWQFMRIFTELLTAMFTGCSTKRLSLAPFCIQVPGESDQEYCKRGFKQVHLRHTRIGR